MVFHLYPNYLILTKHPLTLVYLSFSFFIINLIVKSEGGEIYTLIVAIENTKIYWLNYMVLSKIGLSLVLHKVEG